MRTQDLQALCAVAQQGSITAAAGELGRSQPTVSRQLRRQESDLGTALLRREARGVELTAHGERVAGYAVERLTAEAELRAELLETGPPLQGTVRVVASTVPSEFLVPGLIARFCAQHPGVRTVVSVGNSAQVPTALLEDRADVGFAGRATTDRRLVHRAVASDEIVLAVPAAHPLAAAASVPLEALEGQRLVWREDGSGTQQSFLDSLARAGRRLPRSSSIAQLGSTHSVVSAVEAGMGIGVVSQRAVPTSPTRGVTTVRIHDLPLQRSLWMIHPRRRSRLAHVAAFLDVVSEGTTETPTPPAPGQGD